MSWEELYPVVQEQASYAVLRYDPRRKDKIQELLCQAYEKFLNDHAKGKPIEKQKFKHFVTQRAKQVDLRSVCKKGYGGTSVIDVLSFYRRRPNVDTKIIEFADWMTYKPNTKERVEEAVNFSIDYTGWFERLDQIEKKVFNYLLEGYRVSKIAEFLRMGIKIVQKIIEDLKQKFLKYFQIGDNALPQY